MKYSYRNNVLAAQLPTMDFKEVIELSDTTDEGECAS